MSEEADKSDEVTSSVPHEDEAFEPRQSPRRNFIGWGSIAILGAVLAVAANLSEILGWFAPDATREIVEETRDTMQHTDAKVSELILLLVNQAAASGLNLDIESEDAIRNAVEAIVASRDRQKQAALDRLADGDVAGAAASLERLAAVEAEAASSTSMSAAQTWLEAAALQETLDVDMAADSYEQAAELAPRDAVILDTVAYALLKAGRIDRAESRFNQVVALSPAAATHSASLRGLGNIAQRRANYTEAETYFAEALAVADAGDAAAEKIQAVRSLGLLQRSRGDPVSALQLLEQALSHAEDFGDERLRAFVLSSVGTSHAESGDFATADAKLREALAIYKSHGDRAKQALVIGNLGATALKQGDLEAAEPLLLESVELGEALNWQSSIAYDLINLAMISAAREDYSEADARLGRAQSIADEQEMAELMPVIIFNRGEIAQSAGNIDVACQHWAEATPLFVAMGSQYAEMGSDVLAANCAGEAAGDM